jgi:hypothetical protein
MCGDEMTPGPVARMLEDYRALLAEHGPTWGDGPSVYVGQMLTDPYLMGYDFWGAAFRQISRRHPGAAPHEFGRLLLELDMDEVVRDALGGDVPDNLAVLRVTPGGAAFEARPRAVLGDAAPFRTTLLIDSSREDPVTVLVDGAPYEIAPGGARLVGIGEASQVVAGGERVGLTGLTRRAAMARLRVRAGFPCRWSVWSPDGQGWYPDGAPPKRDFHRLPYFHGDDLVLDVPAEALTVRVARGMEYGVAETTVVPRAGAETLVEMRPERLYDPVARGWYGGDMHVHMNWAGDTVGTPELAAAMQHGEDLHVLNLVAGNVAIDRVYDRPALEHWAGRDLPWSDATHIARMGVEYRNDLLGHFYAFGVTGVPERFHSGFEDDVDWPPNAAACAELRRLGAVTGYSHPYHLPVSDTDPPCEIVGVLLRDCAARENVADAALGLVDSLDVINHSSVAGTAVVYRHLIGAGNRLAVTAGTDAMISFTRRGNQSNPPGWGRVYARVDGPLTAASFAGAIRAGRTFATTGPWLELSVTQAPSRAGESAANAGPRERDHGHRAASRAGESAANAGPRERDHEYSHGPGDTIDVSPGDRLTVTARVVGPEAERLEIRTADGVLAAADVPGADGELRADLVVDGPTYIVAVATGGGPHPRTLRQDAYAHTSPVYIDVAGRRVAREADVRWCLDWIDLLAKAIPEHARLDSGDQLADYTTLLDSARAVYRSRLPG